jgi:hypothetical protein
MRRDEGSRCSRARDPRHVVLLYQALGFCKATVADVNGGEPLIEATCPLRRQT